MSRPGSGPPRAPVALSRIAYDADTDIVTLASDKAEGPTAGTHRLHALEFLARLLAHVPRRGEILRALLRRLLRETTRRMEEERCAAE